MWPYRCFFNFFSQTLRYDGFEPEVRVRPLPEPEPTKRFGFGYSAEPNPRTSGSKSGSNRVRKVREPDRSHLFGTWAQFGMGCEGLFTELEVRREGFLKYQSEYQGHKLWWQ